MMLTGMPKWRSRSATPTPMELKARLGPEFVCRVLNHMERQRVRHCGAAASGDSVEERPLMTSLPANV